MNIRSTALAVLSLSLASMARTIELLNVSYDPTRELYQDINAAFAADWKQKTGDDVKIRQSHGGSGKQARSIIDGLDADVATLALSLDIDAIAERARLLPPTWQKRLPDNSTPYYSTIVLLVRKGNPRKIKDWGDLARPGVSVITPNPKTGGGARWNYLAAWGWALRQPGATEATAKDLVTKIYRNVAVLDAAARGSTTTFVQRGIGDVYISWENEAYLAQRELGKDKFEIIYPSWTILAEPTVAVIDKVARKHGTLQVAEAYLRFLYTPQAQEIIARNFYRPRDEKAAAKHAADFPKVNLFTIDEVFGGWRKAQKVHFDDGGFYDAMLKP